jgi:hypothetical protein
MVRARLVPVLAVAAAIGISACGGASDDPAPGKFADGACVDRASTGGSSNPKVVDCGSARAAGVLEEANKLSDCPAEAGISVFSIGNEGDGKVEGGAFCISAR